MREQYYIKYYMQRSYLDNKRNISEAQYGMKIGGAVVSHVFVKFFP